MNFPDRRPPGPDPLSRNDLNSWKRRQIAAAKARVAIDQQLGDETPEEIKKLAELDPA